jgi:hypothetical protein
MILIRWELECHDVLTPLLQLSDDEEGATSQRDVTGIMINQWRGKYPIVSQKGLSLLIYTLSFIHIYTNTSWIISFFRPVNGSIWFPNTRKA